MVETICPVIDTYVHVHVHVFYILGKVHTLDTLMISYQVGTLPRRYQVGMNITRADKKNIKKALLQRKKRKEKSL